jgi:hypothetical protein
MRAEDVLVATERSLRRTQVRAQRTFAQWLQPVAIGGKPDRHESRGNKPKPLRWVTTGARRDAMVRRASTVRFHQGLCKSPAYWRFYFRIDLQITDCRAGMEPFMEPSGQKRRSAYDPFTCDPWDD